jgi:hypothetical protein
MAGVKQQMANAPIRLCQMRAKSALRAIKPSVSSVGVRRYDLFDFLGIYDFSRKLFE